MSITLVPYDPRVKILRATNEPAQMCLMAARTTQQCAVESMPMSSGASTVDFIQRVAKMGHTSVFEHVSATFMLENVSRGCVDQITRHRMGSFTCSSTHYETHERSAYLVPKELACDTNVEAACAVSHAIYMNARDDMGPEARQLLPLAISCRLIWTVNARSLLHFLRVRLCWRNMREIIMVANLVHAAVCEWFPELFDSSIAYPECARTACDQGHMSCGKTWRLDYLYKGQYEESEVSHC